MSPRPPREHFLETSTAGPLPPFLDKETEVWRDEVTCSKAVSKWQGQCGVQWFSSAQEEINGSNQNSILVPLWSRHSWCISPERDLTDLQLRFLFGVLLPDLPLVRSSIFAFFCLEPGLKLHDLLRTCRTTCPRSLPFVNCKTDLQGTEPWPLHNGCGAPHPLLRGPTHCPAQGLLSLWLSHLRPGTSLFLLCVSKKKGKQREHKMSRSKKTARPSCLTKHFWKERVLLTNAFRRFACCHLSPVPVCQSQAYH